jgi:hypothetical protein
VANRRAAAALLLLQTCLNKREQTLKLLTH